MKEDRKILQVLKDLEWSFHQFDHERALSINYCPICRMRRFTEGNHFTRCALADAIQVLEKRTVGQEVGDEERAFHL